MENYHSKRNQCRQQIRDTKLKSWMDFLKGINANQTASEICSCVNALNGKILERMVNRRLSRFLEDNELLDHRQHAFLPGHGTGTYFGGLSDVLQDAINESLHADIASLDQGKAYNRTWTPRAIRQLIEA